MKLHFVLLLFIQTDYFYQVFFFFPISVVAKHNFKCLCSFMCVLQTRGSHDPGNSQDEFREGKFMFMSK